jgi:prepilin signal peptidase PulO-like enzyme (type II secretory pathway)
MFDAVEGVKFGYILCGIIWAVTLGFAAGNYACSLVHRLPRGRLLLDKKPYCGTCGTLLQVKDLFPVFSALALRHRCRYCRTPFPVSHTWTEVLVGLLFVLAFLQHSFSDRFLLVVCLGTFMITLAAIEANERVVMGRVLVCIAVSGMLYRTLLDGTIYNFFLGAVYGLFLSALVWRKQITPEGHIFKLPPPMTLSALGGLCAGGDNILAFFVFFAAFYATDRLIRTLFRARTGPLITVAFGLAVIIPVLYPNYSQLLHWGR